MAYEFDRTTGQRVYLSSAPISAYPITISMWAYPDIGSNEWQTGVGVFNHATDFICLYTESDFQSTPVGAVWYGGDSDSFTGWTIAFQEWSHILASSSSDSNHRLVLHGTDVDTSTTTINGGFPSSPNISIGGNSAWTNEAMVGRIAEVGIWNTAHLTPGEEQALASGVSPLLIRPQSLVAYVPLVRDTSDPIGGTAWTASGSPTVGVHAPGIIYPSSQELGVIQIGDRTLYSWAITEARNATGALSKRNNHLTLACDDTTSEGAQFFGVMPRGATLSNLALRVVWTATSTSGDVVWEAKIERHQADTTDLDADSFAVAQSFGLTAPTSAGVARESHVRIAGLALDSLAVGESFRIDLSRQPTDSRDTMSGDAEIVSLELIEVP